MTLSTATLRKILDALDDFGTTTAEFLISLLSNAEFHEGESAEEIKRRAHEILNAMKNNPKTNPEVLEWAHQEMMSTYASEILMLVRKTTGYHFSARKATAERLEAIDIDKIGADMGRLAPQLWELLGVLLNADPDLEKRRNRRRERAREMKKAKAAGANNEMDVDMSSGGKVPLINEEDIDEEEETYWEAMGQPSDVFGDDHKEDSDTEENVDEAAERRKALIMIKQAICMSVMMHSTNQQCNALQSLLGIFLHACNAPETVVELLAHIGVSISTTAINHAVSSLSKESIHELRKLGRTLLTAFAYDNVDMDLSHATPTLQNPQPTLVHLTSGTLIPLEHGVTLDDLNVSKELWEKSKLNMHRPKDVTPNPTVTDDDFMDLHPEDPDHPSGLLRRERFNAWMFLHDLVHHGPLAFRKFKAKIGKPEEVDAIPVVKSRQVHAKMMDTPCSSPVENGTVVEDLMSKQAGIGDKQDDPSKVDLLNQVILLFGDLGVGQHIQSLMASRSVEETPWRRMQFIVYGLGLFHVKMACADAVWRILIKPPRSRDESDPHCLMQHVKILRPKETGKIETKPGFRRMHEVIQHVGIVSRLDCWRVELKEQRNCQSLEEFAASEPSLEDLQRHAEVMCRKYVATETFADLRQNHDDLRDQVKENMLLRQQLFLLYEETTYAMNWGDIGRVETCFLPWIWIFQACGKHRYSTFMRKYLRDVHFNYPAGLKKAIRMNILVNPTGKPGRFRGVDWWVEHNNLFLKRIYGGKFSNHTKRRILKESPLIGVFKNARIQVERMFRMAHKTTKHSGPKMEKTFSKLAAHLAEKQTHESLPKRGTKYNVRDVIRIGQNLAMTTKSGAVRGEAGDEEWEDIKDHEEEVEEIEDLLV